MAHKTHIIDLYSLLGHELPAFGSDISQVDNVKPVCWYNFGDVDPFEEKKKGSDITVKTLAIRQGQDSDVAFSRL